MSKFHVNPKTGEPGPCTAQPGNCRFGVDSDDHYPSKEVAQAAYEVSMKDYGLPAHQKTSVFLNREQFLSEANAYDPLPYEDLYEIETYYPALALSPQRVGIDEWQTDVCELPHQVDDFWDGYKPQTVDLTGTKVFSAQKVLRYGALRHYLENPEEPLEYFTEEEGIVPRVMVNPDGHIYLQEGNHRVAAALLAKRPLALILAPEEEVRNYLDSEAVIVEDES